MSQDNQFHQYGYDHYLKATSKKGKSAKKSSDFGGYLSVALEMTRKPMVRSAAFVAVAVLFVGVIIAAYPSGDSQSNIPIVKADLRPIRSEPVDRGGMSIPNGDSTILARSGGADINDGRRIENLLSQEDDAYINKEQAIARALSSNPDGAIIISLGDEKEWSASNINIIKGRTLDKEKTSEAVSNIKEIKMEEPIDAGDAIVDVVPVATIDEPAAIANVVTEETTSIDEADNVLQKIGSTVSSVDGVSDDDSEFVSKTAIAALRVKPKYVGMHKAATSPDTIDFVRKILSEGSNQAAIEPSVGAAAPAVSVTAGSYFVQLASITDASRASGEWVKMQAKYNVLATSKFRVQEASLSSGTFYRIQAGPMSKASATEICNKLKAQGKAGGCLVVK